MSIFVLGLNHRSAPISIREKFAIPEGRLGDFLRAGAGLSHVEELFVLSTCNRVELYGFSRQPRLARENLGHFLAQFQEQETLSLNPHLYFYEGEEAVRHGFRVAGSLDSMILGEPQILGQFKEAYRIGGDAGTVGRVLHKFSQHAFHTAKKVRTETEIASNPVSVSYAAVALAQQIFGDLAGKTVFILGAGKMSELALRHFKQEGIGQLLVANRTPERAVELAEKVGGKVVPYENFEKWLGDADIVLTSTGAPNYLINADLVQEAMRVRKNRPMFFIDIAVPRNVSPDVNHLSNVYLYDIDDLGAVVEANKGQRVKEAEKALALVDREVLEFSRVLKTLEIGPTLSSLQGKVDKICREELEKAFGKIPGLDADGRQTIESMTRAIVNKVLHEPMVTLKEEALPEDPVDYSAVVRKLFRLDEI